MPPLSATQEKLPVTHLVGYSPTESSFLVTSSIAKGMDVMSQSGALAPWKRPGLSSELRPGGGAPLGAAAAGHRTDSQPRRRVRGEGRGRKGKEKEERLPGPLASERDEP